MKIIGVHFQHDGGVAIVSNGELLIYMEAQKGNGKRYAGLHSLTVGRLMTGMAQLDGQAEVVATGGWHGEGAGYYGCESNVTNTAKQLRKINLDVPEFATSHERAHIMCSYALSPFPDGEPCYALVYEGMIGRFYRIDSKCEITPLSEAIVEPGHRYAALFELADPVFPDQACGLSFATAGKLMALAATREDRPLDPREQNLLDTLVYGVNPVKNPLSVVPSKQQLRESPYWNVGHTNPQYRHFAAKFSDALFGRFYSVAKSTVKERLPLLISGGCGLNCGWNSKWRDCGLFSDVFVPPCTDDSGIAIGVAADAQRHYTGSAKLRWNVYCGEAFERDMNVPTNTFRRHSLDYSHVARLLANDAIIAWVQGRCEIGPRALGNRSLLASPFNRSMTDRLNLIKSREEYRPVAPICLEEEVSKWFHWSGSSPHMLYFQEVRSDLIPAVTHDDRSARIQTVTGDQNRPMYELLRAFSAETGVGVLCNTSLNFPGRSFINRTSDLIRYVGARDIDAMVIENELFIREAAAVASAQAVSVTTASVSPVTASSGSSR